MIPERHPLVRAALVQSSWTGDRESMTAKHELLARAAAGQGAQIIGFPELFTSPYFCQLRPPHHQQDTEAVPAGPTTRRMQQLAYATGLVIVAPVHEADDHGSGYSTAAVIDSDGTYLGKCRKRHIPHSKGPWERSAFQPGNLTQAVFTTSVGRIGVCVSHDRHFPEYWQALGQSGAQLVYNPSAAYRSLSSYLWQLEQPAAAVANEYFVAAPNRVGRESQYGDNDFHGASYFADPCGQFVGDIASATEEEVLIRDLDFGLLSRESRRADLAWAHKEREDEPLRVAARLCQLRDEGRSGDAYLLMSRAVAGAVSFAPRFAHALEECGRSADVATLLWELSAQSADRVAALVRAFSEAGRRDDCRVLLHQSAARPAADVAALAAALRDADRSPDAVTLLTAFIRSRADDVETAQIVREQQALADALLEAAAQISPLRRSSVAAALRHAAQRTS